MHERAAWWILISVTSVAVRAHAQDTRRVSEPRIPPSCAVLTARLSAPGGVLAEAAERTTDTARIQDAIDRCMPGQAVELRTDPAKDVFLSGPLRLKKGVTLVIAAKTALFASRNPRDYDVVPGSCGVVGDKGRGCRPLILAEEAPGSGVMGDGVIEGRGGSKLLGQERTWWELAHQAKVEDRHQSCPRLLIVKRSNDFTLYRTTLRNSPNFHVVVEQTDGFTAWGVKILTPKTARNTDGIDPSSSRNVTIAHCFIATGDDNVALKAGDLGPTSQVTIAHNHFYSGHGMSIGSGTNGGVRDIHVLDLSIDGTDNGLRIKSDRSRGGLVKHVVYENVCLRNVTNPILITSKYTLLPGTKLPVYREILLKNVRSLTPGAVTLRGFDPEHRLGITFDNVVFDRLPADIQAEYTEIKLGPWRGNFAARGHDVAVTDASSLAGTPLDCQDRFAPFPEDRTLPTARVRVPPEDQTFYVAASGSGDFSSIQRAIDLAPREGAVIHIAPGTYRERLTITKPNLRLESFYQDAKRTVIVFGESAATAGGTLRSATVTVEGRNFSAENLTIANDYTVTHPQKSQGSQALALLVKGDRAAFRNVRLLGHQDTLYVGSQKCDEATRCAPSRQYFEGCYIEGNVDFIFGDGKAVFERCEIHNNQHSIGFITAQGKQYPGQDSGFVFDHCRLTAEPGVSGVWLGRPWRPYATVVFLSSEMGAHIEPGGWREWHPGETSYLDTAFYAEQNSSGPGGGPSRRDPHTRQLAPRDAARFVPRRFLAGADGWNPMAVR